MAKKVKLFALGIALMFSLSLSVNAMEGITTETDLESCLNGTDAVCKLAENTTITLNNSVTVANEKTLDLNSNKLTTVKPIAVNGVKLVVKNGTMYTKDTDPMILAKEGSTVEVESGTTLDSTAYYGAVIQIKGSATPNISTTTVTVKEGAVLKGNYPITVSNVSGASYGTKINLYGTLEAITTTNGSQTKIGPGININGNIVAKDGNVPEVNIYEGAIITTKEGVAIYAAGYAKWNISGGSLTGTESLSIKSGVFNITGGTFTATGAYVSPENVQSNNNGSESTGAAISITGNDGYANGVEINVENATVVSQNGYAVFEGITKGTTPAVKGMTITNGDFTGKVGAVYAENAEDFVEGGTFNSDVADKYLVTSKVEVDGVYYVGEQHTITITKPENGEVTTSLDKAIAGQTVELTVKANENYKAEVKVVDANGKNVEIKDGKFVMPDSDVTVTATFTEIEKEETTTEAGQNSDTIESPNTVDNVAVYMILSLIALFGFGLATKKFKKNIN